MEIKFAFTGGQEKVFASAGEAVDWGYKEVRKINQDIHDLILRRDAIVSQLGLKVKQRSKEKSAVKGGSSTPSPDHQT